MAKIIYTKTDASGRQIFSDCRVIELDGTWISNPSEEQIAQAGWVEYTPPVVPSSPREEPDYAEIVEAVKKMLSTSVADLTDEEALEVAALYPTWASKMGESVTAGERLWYGDALYKVLQAHTVQADWTPDTAVSLFVQVSIEEWPEIPEYITAESVWMAGQKGTWKGEHYICQLDNCVWNPDVAPQYWQLVA